MRIASTTLAFPASDAEDRTGCRLANVAMNMGRSLIKDRDRRPWNDIKIP